MSSLTPLYTNAATVCRTAAEALAYAAIGAAEKMGIAVSVAVVDAGGAMKWFSRSDQAPFLTADAAIDKAWTAASYGYPTHVWNEYLADPKLQPLSKLPRFLALGGGYPLMSGGKLTGGIGVSGGTYVQDQQIAEAAIRAIGFDL